MDSRGQDPTEAPPDPRNLTFSQANGYENIPGPLNLEELPIEARIHIWNVFYENLNAAKFYSYSMSATVLRSPWDNIFKSVHINHDHQPIDDLINKFHDITSELRNRIETNDFNKVFDLLQFIMRQPGCPREFIERMKGEFKRFKLAYIIDDGPPPTILPAVTKEEGENLLESLATLREAGLNGGTKHLREASECINQGDWAGSIRESIHAVESVARILDPKASENLGPALASIEKHGALHPALKNAFIKLYGYTNRKEGIRHALLNDDGTDVGMDEAVFMLGACASFTSYLWRKHQGNMGD